MVKNWDPLGSILDANSRALSVSDYLEQIKSDESVILIDMDKIIRWEHKDRPENELGNVDELAETFKTVGQQQPCILRNSKKHPGKYELIIGERRWRAAEKVNLPLKGIIKELDDKTAILIQAIENDKRKDISEYAKGMSYAKKIAQGLVTQFELADILKISKQQISRLLSYAKIPEPLFLSIGDFRKVTARTAEELVRLSKKSERHLEILIKFADKIREGKYGSKKIEQELIKELDNENNLNMINNITDNNGKKLFTWTAKSGLPEMKLSKEIFNLITQKNISLDKLFNDIKGSILKNIE